MKANPLLLCFALQLLLGCGALGQASFWLNNHQPPLVDAPVFDAQGVPLAGASYLAELWGGTASDSLTPALAFFSRQRVIIPFRTGSGAGIFRDTYGGRDPADSPTVLQAPSGGMAWLQVRAWDSRLGATYEEALARGIGGYGASPVFAAQGTDPSILQIQAAPLTGLQSFSLLPLVPEPATIWILLLAAPILFLCRRRRALDNAGSGERQWGRE
jgi:hypothetical protein